MGSKRRRFTQEFKDEAVRLALQADSIRQVAKELGIGQSTLFQWIEQAKKRMAKPTPAESDELRQLRRDFERVREERDILKKAVAFFANEKH
jgi:transposase